MSLKLLSWRLMRGKVLIFFLSSEYYCNCKLFSKSKTSQLQWFQYFNLTESYLTWTVKHNHITTSVIGSVSKIRPWTCTSFFTVHTISLKVLIKLVKCARTGKLFQVKWVAYSNTKQTKSMPAAKYWYIH